MAIPARAGRGRARPTTARIAIESGQTVLVLGGGGGGAAISGSGAPREAASRTARSSLDGYQPRARHSARWGRSVPMVVSLPWPG